MAGPGLSDPVVAAPSGRLARETIVDRYINKLDTTFLTPSNGQTLVYDSTTGTYKPSAGGAFSGDPFGVPFNAGHTASQRRAAIQAVLDSAFSGATVRLEAGYTWDVGPAASNITVTTAGGTTSLPYCIKVPSGVTFDLNGSTLRRNAGSGDNILLVNAHPTTGGGDVNIKIINGILDGNSIDNVTAATAWLFGITGGGLDRIHITNARRLGMFIAGCTDMVMGILTADTNQAAPFTFGLNASGQGLTRCHLGTVRVRNTAVYAGNPTNFPGNPIVCVATDCTFDTWDVYSATAGIKVYVTDGLRGSVVVTNTQTGTDTNSGLKLQGDVSNPVKNVQIAEVRSSNQNGEGLYMERTENCQIGLYDGFQNALLSAAQDVWLGGTRDTLGSVQSRSSSGKGVLFRNYADAERIERVAVKNPVGFAVQASMAAGQQHYIADLLTEDDRGGGALMTRGLQIDGTGGTMNVGRHKITGFTGVPINISAGGAQFGDIRRNAQAGNYTIIAADPDYIGITSTAAARTITLPTANLLAPGRTFTVKDESGAAATNNITVQRAGTDTIEGANTKVINTNYGSVRLYTDGVSKWFAV